MDSSQLTFSSKQLPAFLTVSTNTPTENENEKAKIIAAAQAEMDEIVTERMIMTALARKMFLVTGRVYNLRDKMFVYFEKKD